MATANETGADSGRGYVVLAFDGATERWQEIGRATGATAKDAIADVVSDEDEGTYVAVPVRSWQPVTRKVQRVVKATWS